MTTTYPLPTLAATVNEFGISTPTYADVLASLQASFKSIYGTDSYIDPDSQDGQLLAIFAQAIHDCNQSTVAAYNSFSPVTAQGAGLSSVVKINHIARAVPSNSQVVVTLVGQAGTVITDGFVSDLTSAHRWALPTTVTIPISGTTNVTATCEDPGAIAAGVGSLTKIMTPTAGWQTVTNASAASQGEPVESDYDLRIRQQTSTALRSFTVLDGMVGALQGLLGVSYASAYENDTGSVDANGLPAHSIAAVVQGGDSAQIAQVIFDKKTPGCATYGTTSVSVLDSMGIPRVINYFVPSTVLIKVTVTITAGIGYTSVIGDQIKQAVADFANSQVVGRGIEITRLYVPALLQDSANSETYTLVSVLGALVSGGALAATPIVMAFNQKAGLQLSDITLTLV